MSNGWKKLSHVAIIKQGWEIHKSRAPHDKFYVSYKGGEKTVFFDAAEAKEYVEGEIQRRGGMGE